MLSLSDAINHFETVAEALKQDAETEYYPIVEDKEKADCLECAREYEQLVEWLKELKYIKSSSSYAELTALRKFKAENERPKGEWGKNGECPFCSYLRQWEDDNFCGHCGAEMQKGGAE